MFKWSCQLCWCYLRFYFPCLLIRQLVVKGIHARTPLPSLSFPSSNHSQQKHSSSRQPDGQSLPPSRRPSQTTHPRQITPLPPNYRSPLKIHPHPHNSPSTPPQYPPQPQSSHRHSDLQPSTPSCRCCRDTHHHHRRYHRRRPYPCRAHEEP